jgi:hypothetical protein
VAFDLTCEQQKQLIQKVRRVFHEEQSEEAKPLRPSNILRIKSTQFCLRHSTQGGKEK